jgi:hypothetical protein
MKKKKKKSYHIIGKAPFEGYEEITREEELALERMSIEESARLTEILLKEVKLWMK